MGVPPAARMPAFTRSDNRRRWKLQGMISIQVLATPMIGRDKSSSVNPTAFNIARAGARSGPTSKSRLVSFSSLGMTSLLSFPAFFLLLVFLRLRLDHGARGCVDVDFRDIPV